ncbi:MAG TPA: ROK family protein [Tepidisphaeraceae bacterium]
MPILKEVGTKAPRKPRGSKSENDKRNILIQTLHRKGRGSRLRLARELQISNSRVCDLVDGMLLEGLLVEQEVGGDRRGRRGVSVGLNPNYGQLVGFDMEAKRLRLVVTDFAGQILWQVRKPFTPPKDRRAVVDEILLFIEDSMREANCCTHALAIGLAASGISDTSRGLIIHYDPIPQLVDIPLRDLISERVGLPCVMENNIRAMALAEWTGGAAQGLMNVVCMAVRSGIGAGIILNGRLQSGSHGFCGELGYMVVPRAGSSSHWKNIQETVSESALGIDAESSGFTMPEPIARRVGELVGAQLASIAAVLDPEAFVLAGPMLNPDGPVWPHVLRSYRETALAEIAQRVQILPARLGPFAAALGAAHRCLYELFPVGAAQA